jgi:SCF-associated factor 1
VLKMDKLYTEHSTRVWHYVSECTGDLAPLLNRNTQLPNYSEINEVEKHPAFHTTTSDNGEERPPQVELSADTMLITHVSYIALMFRIPCLRYLDV